MISFSCYCFCGKQKTYRKYVLSRNVFSLIICRNKGILKCRLLVLFFLTVSTELKWCCRHLFGLIVPKRRVYRNLEFTIKIHWAEKAGILWGLIFQHNLWSWETSLKHLYCICRVKCCNTPWCSLILRLYSFWAFFFVSLVSFSFFLGMFVSLELAPCP